MIFNVNSFLLIILQMFSKGKSLPFEVANSFVKSYLYEVFLGLFLKLKYTIPHARISLYQYASH